MATLQDIAALLGLARDNLDNPVITGVAENSGLVEPGYLFAAVEGSRHDGHDYVQAALDNGAVAIISQRPGFSAPVPVLTVSEVRPAMALAAALVHNYPASRLKTVALTGTNGKTTVGFLLEETFNRSGLPTGLMGTLGFRWAGRFRPTSNTTPEGPIFQACLAQMRKDGVRAAVMEISSHALSLGRVAGSRFQVALFTNLSRDHLDYHRDMEDYFQAKRRLFTDYLAPDGRAVINADDEYGRRLASELGGRAITYGFEPGADLQARDFKQSLAGLEFVVREARGGLSRLKSALLGRVNAYNLLAALGGALALGLGREEAVRALSQAQGAPGRLERVEIGDGRLALVDYAHTPDALAKAVDTCRELTSGRLITVFGAGGDRDRGKRPLMAQAALSGSDLVVLTSDNPRTEAPEAILADLEKGLAGAFKLAAGQRFPARAEAGRPAYLIEADRAAAIRRAVSFMEAGDLALIAGKGHEDYQIIGRAKIDFDDRQEARRALLATRKKN